MARNNNNLGVRRELQDLGEALEAFLDALGFGRQAQVLQDDHRLVATQLDDGRFAIFGREYVIAFEAPFELAEEAWIVLDDQEFAAVLLHCRAIVPRSRSPVEALLHSWACDAASVPN